MLIILLTIHPAIQLSQAKTSAVEINGRVLYGNNDCERFTGQGLFKIAGTLGFGTRPGEFGCFSARPFIHSSLTGVKIGEPASACQQSGVPPGKFLRLGPKITEPGFATTERTRVFKEQSIAGH